MYPRKHLRGLLSSILANNVPTEEFQKEGCSTASSRALINRIGRFDALLSQGLIKMINGRILAAPASALIWTDKPAGLKLIKP